MKAKYKLLLGRRKNYPLNIELEVYKGADCRVFISTGITLDNERQWDESRQIILRNNNAAAYNHFLKNLILNIERAELEAEERQIAFTKDLIRLAAKNDTIFEEINVMDKLREYIYEHKTWREGTIRVENANVKRLQSFVDAYKGQKGSKLYFNEFTLSFLKDFDKCLCKSLKDISRAHIHFSLKKLLYKAQKDGLIKYNPYEDFEIPRLEEKKKPSLTQEQVTALENIPDKVLEDMGIQYDVLRDRVLFSCYTGLRISDSLALRKCDVCQDEHGLTIQFKAIKTGQRINLPLYLLFDGKPERIAQKYLEHNPVDDLLFPYMGRSGRDYKLKRLFKLVGIPETYTFHATRHTCASLLAEKVNDPFVIRDVLGHVAMKTSMKYITQSHKTAERKLATIQWEGQNNRGNSITLMRNEISKLCKTQGFSMNQTFVIIGNLMQNPDKFEMIKSWVSTFSALDCTEETMDDKLQTLFNTL
ncbi:MAG: site-specific integrase [Bacteroidales bacterium]|nr:site-specific integrase [Bacteroidales bacterium]